MSYSSKISRRGISPLDIDLSKAVFNIKRKVLFTVDQHHQGSSSTISGNAIVPSCNSTSQSSSPIHCINALPSATKNQTPTKSSRASPVEILYNPNTSSLRRSDLASANANAAEIQLDDLASLSLSTSPSASPCSGRQYNSPNEEDQFTQLVHRITEGLRYHAPELCDEGENGTYFLRDKEGKRIGVFKSADEEGASSPKRKINSLPLMYHAGAAAGDYPEDEEHFNQFDLEMNGGEITQLPLDDAPNVSRRPYTINQTNDYTSDLYCIERLKLGCIIDYLYKYPYRFRITCIYLSF